MPIIRPLPNKPLVEAIFELRWQIDKEKSDPRYSLFVGSLYDCVKSEYPTHEPLPASEIPIRMAGNIVQHRFRAKNNWPLVQIGPGIVTLNDTTGYIWKDFGQRVKSFVKKVFEVYPEPSEFKIEALVLRYIDSFDFDKEKEGAFKYIKQNLKLAISFPSQLFEDTTVINKPEGFRLTAVFPVGEPKGEITINLGTGDREGKPALIMETSVRSNKDELANMPEGFEEWIEKAHKLTDDWFFKFIEGKLERRFAGE